MSKLLSEACFPARRWTSVIGRTALVTLLLASSAWAEVGVVSQIVNGQIIRDGQPIETDEGTLVEQGDELTTEPNGLIQVQLLDGTRFVVYADSSINIDTALIGSDENVFESLSVGLTAGIFRLVSGNSDSEAYEVSTPTATMGIRGTIVDVNERPPFTYFVGTDSPTTIRRNDPNGNPIEATGVVNPGQCDMFRVGADDIVEIQDPSLREDMPSVCHAQGIFLTGYARGETCEPELLCEDFDPVYDDETLEEIARAKEAYEEQFGELPLDQAPDFDELLDFLEELEEASLQEGPLLDGPPPPFGGLTPAQPGRGNNAAGGGPTIQASTDGRLPGTGSFGGGGSSFFSSITSSSSSSSDGSGINDCVEPNSKSSKCCNNGFGNDDQCAPGNSCDPNNAENVDCEEE